MTIKPHSSLCLETVGSGENLHNHLVRHNPRGTLFSYREEGRCLKLSWLHSYFPKVKLASTSWQVRVKQGQTLPLRGSIKAKPELRPSLIQALYFPLRDCCLTAASAVANLACLGSRAPSDHLNLVRCTCEQFIILI